MKKLYVHILNVAGLVLLTVFNLFAYLGLNFTPLDEPLTAEYTHLASFYVLLGSFYYLQLQQISWVKFIVIITIEFLCIYTWALFGEGVLESLIE
ncbi:hypothetical protein [Salimicrobium salexigens]|uniref:Uncharacterized protein n=1 Tax=Salimicrobium salexigens TaxID=908941 RepID=A0ABY1KQM9_9BACI|nr:hypothetical protein [Salimicrobium salexigens]SIS65811.1 hypothetical protein SAMN05421758_103225 [Salimicrobium salexigens]